MYCWLCCWGGPLGGRSPRPSGDFCIFWRRRLGVLVIMVESRLGLDDHGEMVEASGLHWRLYRTRSMEVRCSLLCGAHCCTPSPSTLTCSRTVGPQQLPPWPSRRPKLNIIRERIKSNALTVNLSQRMNMLSVCRSMLLPLERVQTLNASLEKILEARVNVLRKDKIHWVSALLHRLHVSRSLTFLRPQIYYVKVRQPARLPSQLLSQPLNLVERV